MVVRTKIKDFGMKKMLKTMEKFESSPHVKVGLPMESQATNSSREGGITNVEIAVKNEFGSPSENIPERSHIRKAYDINFKKRAKLTDNLLLKVQDGSLSLEDALDRLGLFMVANIKKVISAGIAPKSSRGSGATPLIDTGIYISSISYVKKIGDE